MEFFGCLSRGCVEFSLARTAVLRNFAAFRIRNYQVGRNFEGGHILRFGRRDDRGGGRANEQDDGGLRRAARCEAAGVVATTAW